MQTLSEIRRLLAEAGLSPRRALGQCFLIDRNLMGRLVELAELGGGETVLEVGAGTGSLTEELLARAARVVAVEMDRGLAGLLRRRLGGRENFTLVEADVLAGKHALCPAVLAELPGDTHMVSNLPYNVATPLLAECLLQSWRALRAGGGCGFSRWTFTVQREVADRLAARPGSRSYGPVSVLVALLGRLRSGPIVPPEAFWPRPKVSSRIVRIDFDERAARSVSDADALLRLLATAFGQRRKQLGAAGRSRAGPIDARRLRAALEAAGVDLASRPAELEPGRYRQVAEMLASDRGQAGREGDRGSAAGGSGPQRMCP